MKKIIVFMITLVLMFAASTSVYATEESNMNEPALVEIEQPNEIEPNGEVGYYWTFTKKSQTKYTADDKTKKVSACYAAGMTAEVTSSKTYSASFSSGCPSAVKTNIFNSCTISIGKSLTNSKTYSGKNTSAVKDAHIIFTPYYVKIVGTATQRSTLGEVLSTKAVTARYPKKADGFVDGRFSLEYHAVNQCNR